MHMGRVWLLAALLPGILCPLLAGCQGPRLLAANAVAPQAQPTAGAAAERPTSRAARLAAPLLEAEAGRQGGPYDRPVSEAAIDQVERAVRLRLEARRKRARRCSATQRARDMPAPAGNGDDMGGTGVDLGRLFSGLKKLIEYAGGR